MGREREYDYGLDPDERYEPGDEPEEAPFDRSRPHVMTVLGPIRPEELGVTLVHEHVIAKPPRALPDGPDPDPDLILDDPHAALAELEDFYAAGGRAVVDTTVADTGRDIAAVHWVAARAPVHVVSVTGYGNGAHSGRTLSAMAADDVAAACTADVSTGIGGTGIRAGAIRVGTSPDRISPLEATALRGAARAHLATGAPIMTHGGLGTTALEQLAILQEEGVDPSRVIVGHQGIGVGDTDPRAVLAVLAAGAWVSFDPVSRTAQGSDEERAATIARLVAAGFGGRILLSGNLARRSSLRAYGGSPGLIYPVESFPLLLMDAGLDAPTVRQLLVDNPARALAIR